MQAERVFGTTTGRPALAIVVSLTAFWAGLAVAQTTAELLEVCRDEARPGSQRIGACTRLIEQPADEEARAEAHLQRGLLNEFGEKVEAAVSDYTQSIKLRPANPLTYFNRGNALAQLGRYDEAIADYTQAIELDRKEPDFFNNRGQAYDRKAQHDLAIADYTEAFRLDDTNARPLYNRGLAYANKGDYRQAIVDFGKAIQIAPDDADLYVARGAAHEEVGDLNAAKADYSRVLEIDPDNEDALEGLSRVGN
jgi:tetratricopeptide (TPR) repeat protein